MRPLSITIEGLTSFKTSQEVDFSKLDLFVITGPTGSGKSSILDAITFALYGSVPRVGGHELRDLISHGSSYMRVRLDFQVNGAHYRVARRMGRNSHQATFERIDGDSSVTEVERGGIRAINQRLEEVVGLDFKAFTKAVLLPQGAFHEFLQGEVGERRRILMRLLDLGRYEAAGQAARREANRLDAIVGERGSLIQSNYADATMDQLSQLEGAVTVARNRHTKVERAQEEAKKIGSAASDAERQILALLDGTSQVEAALADLNRLAQAWPRLDAENRSTQDELEGAQKLLDAAQERVEVTRQAVAQIIERTGDASQLTRLGEAAGTRAREQVEVEKLDGQLADARKAVTQLTDDLAAAEKNESEVRAVLKSGESTREDAERQLSDARAVLGCTESSVSLAELERQLEVATAQANEAQAQADDARAVIRHLEQKHAAVALRLGLSPGDRCPVCDSVVETLPESDGDTDSLFEEKAQGFRAAEGQEREAKDAVVALRTRARDATDLLEERRAALREGVVVPGPEQARALVADAESTRVAAIEAESTAREAVDAAVRAVFDAKTALTTAETEVAGMVTARSATEERLNAALSTLTAVFTKKLPDDLNSEITGRRDTLNAADEARQRADDSAEAARAVRDTAQEQRASCTERVAAFDEEAAGTRTAARMGCDVIARLLEGKAMPASPRDEAERAQMLAGWVDCCDAHLKAASSAVTRSEKTVSDAVNRLTRLAVKAGLKVESEKAAEIADELDQAALDAHGSVVAAEKDVEALKRRIIERENLETEMVEDRRLGALYQTLARELRTDRFIAFVLEESMNQLALQASDQLLQISDGRYSLIADEGSFEVVDHHNADERRSVATLSGGETFLASLSLALALSTGLRELAGMVAGRLEAIFIDEGFGALDPETLDVVVDALERLREGDRMVGVITHVPTLAERIPSGLSVENNGSSSRILVR